MSLDTEFCYSTSVLSVANDPFTLNAILSSVIILCVLAPLSCFKVGHLKVEHSGKLLPGRTLYLA
jgi:hypothetical protein